MPATVSDHQDPHTLRANPMEQVISKHLQRGAANIILEEIEATRRRPDPLKEVFKLGKESVAQLRTARAIEIFRRLLDVRLDGRMKIQGHLPIPCRNWSHVSAMFG